MWCIENGLSAEGEHRVALRVCLAAVQQEGRPLLNVVTTHLDYKRPRAQVQMALHLQAFVSAAQKDTSRAATLCCGDFNCEPFSEPVLTF